MRRERPRDLEVVGDDGNRGRIFQVWGRGRVSIPPQVSLLGFCWEEEQVKLIKYVALNAKRLFLRLVSPEESVKWEGPFQDHLVQMKKDGAPTPNTRGW